MSITPDLFRRVGAQFATGVTVVTTALDGQTHGMTANAFTTVSLEPPLVLVCVDWRARTHRFIEQSGAFAVNILAADQQDLSVFFAGPHNQLADELAEVPHRAGATGSPLIDGAVGYLDCRLVAAYPAGDHTIFVGEVVDADYVPGRPPLIFHEGRYTRLERACVASGSK